MRLCARVASVLLLFAAGSALAQQVRDKPLDSYFREVWTTRDGLPHNLVHQVVQTPDGYLWFATWEGVVRYNGHEFRVFDRGNVPQLHDNGVRTLRPARDGGLWLGTSRGGVTRYRPDGSWGWLSRADGLAQDEVMDLLEDSRGHLWVATESAGITRVGPGGALTQFSRDTGLPSNVMYQLLEDPDGAVWAATGDGLARFDGERFVPYAADEGLPPGAIFSLAVTPDGSLYAGTEHGVYRREQDRFRLFERALPDDNVFRLLADRDGALWLGTVNGGLYRYRDGVVDQLGSVRGLPNNRVSALFQDREGSIWVGTNGGLLRLRDAPFTTYTTEHGLPDDYVRSVVADPQGRLWIGTSGGLGFSEGDRFGKLTRADGLPGDSILSLALARGGGLWIGTYSHGALLWKDGVSQLYDTGNGLPGNQVRAIIEGRDGRLWIGTTRGVARIDADGIRVFTEADGMPRDFVISMHEDRDGRIWVGTSNGLARIEGDTVHVHPLGSMDDAQDVFGFHETESGRLWMATDRGLVRFHDGQLRLLGRAQGLPVDSVFQVLCDDTGHAWLTSNRGILRARASELDAVADGMRAQVVFERFGEGDGLASAQNNGGAGPVVARAPDGRLWFGTAKGLASTDPARLPDFARADPPVVIEDVLVEDRSVSTNGVLQLPPGTRKLEFRFAGLSYLMPTRMLYRYRLDGFDADWVQRGNVRFAQFTNLAPGNYVFRVQAANPGGSWGANEASFAFRVEPSLTQRPAFWVALAALLLLALYGAYRLRVHRLEVAQRRLREEIERSTADLRQHAERLLQADREKTLLLERLQQQSEAFERQAREDSLTGLMNRRSFDEVLAREFAHSLRSGRPLAVALADLDHFKQLNDAWSHAAGDEALRVVARRMRQVCREMDVLARWGGEEFALLFPDTTRELAHQICERLRAAIEATDCIGFAPGFRLTISIGVTDQTGFSHHEKMISRADARLYESKRGGRNRVSS